MKTIIYKKFLNILEEKSFKQILMSVLLWLWSVILSLILIYTDQTIEILLFIYNYNNFTLPKIIFSFWLIFNYKIIINFWKNVINELKPKIEEDKIEGIPTMELIEHLFFEWSFKRDEVEKKFLIPRYKFTILAKKFDELKILIRWENNSRILNPEFSRQQIAETLSWKKSSENLQIKFKNIWENLYSNIPDMSTIKNKINKYIEKKDPPSPFTTKKIVHNKEMA